MRHSLLLLAVLVIGCSGAPSRSVATGSGGGTDGGPVPDVRVMVADRRIIINGKTISGTPLVADFVDAIGKPDRTWDSGGSNLIHTWDKIGVIVYERKWRPDQRPAKRAAGTGLAITASFLYRPMASTFTPKKLFSGAFVLDGHAITATSTLASIVALSGATQPYSDASVLFDRGLFQVFVIEETKNTSIDLVELTFAQRGSDRPGKPIRRPPPPVPTDALEEECKNGDASRCTSLALAFQTGARGRKHPERAFELAKAGCTAGDPFGCLMIGNMLDAGIGTAKAPAEAKAAWKRACSLGYKATCALAK